MLEAPVAPRLLLQDGDCISVYQEIVIIMIQNTARIARCE